MNNPERLDFVVQPGGPLQGRLRLPGDKSISHRALLLGAIAEGSTSIRGFLESEDTHATMRALQAMGVEIERGETGDIIVRGVGLHGLQSPGTALDLGNSGTSVRLLAGLLCGQDFDSELCGDESLMQRPMQRIIKPLRQMGADIECSRDGTLPIRIGGKQVLAGITYHMPVASAQLKSSILLAGLYASGTTCVIEPAVTRDHSERMLAQFGCPPDISAGAICLASRPLRGQDVNIPADISSAAFFLVAATIVPGSDITLDNVGMNPTRSAAIDILTAMGADIGVHYLDQAGQEPVASVRVRHRQLSGIEIPAELIPVAIDELPVLMVAAACAEGETRLGGAAELRVKESDRIQAMTAGLKDLGVDVDELDDGMHVRGGTLQGGTVNSFTDHRIAMAFSIAGLVAGGSVTIEDCANVNTSFPGFADSVRGVGGRIELARVEV